MRNLIILVLIAALTVTVTPSKAQEAGFTKSDPEAMALLKSVKKTYQTESSLKIDFKLEMEFPGQAMESQNGSLIQLGEKFVLEMPERMIISDTEKVWMYSEEMNEVTINDADFEDTEEFMSPSDIFNLDESGDFIFGLISQDKQAHYIECKPIDEYSDYSKMRLAINRADNTVNHLKMFMKDGSRFTVYFTEVDIAFKTSEKTFTFDVQAYDGVHVEDLRF